VGAKGCFSEIEYFFGIFGTGLILKVLREQLLHGKCEKAVRYSEYLLKVLLR
jgi:hypothetical protein